MQDEITPRHQTPPGESGNRSLRGLFRLNFLQFPVPQFPEIASNPVDRLDHFGWFRSKTMIQCLPGISCR
jgi:hypothetical protein